MLEPPTEDRFEEKCGALRNKLLEGSVAENTLVKDAFVAGREVVKIEPDATFFSKSFEGQGQRDAICQMDLAAPLDTLKSVSSTSEIDSLKVDYLDRYTSVVILGCRIAALGSDIPADFNMHAKFNNEVAALSEFFQHAVSDRFTLMEKDQNFMPKFEDGKRVIAWCQSLASRMRIVYAQTVTAMVDDLKLWCPPDSVVNNAKILSDKILQNSLFGNPNRDKLNPAVQALQDKLHILKSVRGRSRPWLSVFWVSGFEARTAPESSLSRVVLAQPWPQSWETRRAFRRESPLL